MAAVDAGTMQSGRYVADAVVAMVSSWVLYTAITMYQPSVSEYHGEIAGLLLAVSAVLLLPGLFLPRPGRLRFDTDGWAWSALFLVMAASSYRAGHQFASEKLHFLFALMVFGLSIRWLLEHSAGRALEWTLLGIGLVHAAILVLVMQHAPGADPGRPYDQSWVPYHGHIRHFAYHGMLAAAAGVALTLFGNRYRLPGVLLASMALFGILYFGARGALLGWLGAVLLIAYFSKRYEDVLLVAGAALLLGLAVSYGFQSALSPAPFTGPIHERLQSLADATHSTGRTGIWQAAIAAAIEKPFLGWGLDGYRISDCCRANTVQPHNVIVQWFIETGLLGLVAAGWIVWRLLGTGRCRTGAGSSAGAAGTAGLLGGLVIFGMVDGLFYHGIPLLLFCIVCALHYRELREEELGKG